MDGNNSNQVISEELRLTNNLCNHLSSGAPMAFTGDIQWETIYPDHLSMNIDFQEFITIWNTYTKQTLPTHCEVIVN